MDMLISLAEAVSLAFIFGAIVGAIVALHLRGAEGVSAEKTLKSNKDINGV